jgi:hypothetical protein
MAINARMANTLFPDAESIEPCLPCSDPAKALDAWLTTIRQFLHTSSCPPEISKSNFQTFITYATKFFVLHDKLWHKHPEGHHQLIIDEPKWYRLICEAHNNLGHKGIFMVCTRLLLHFWWPMLSEDVKWYIKSCHKCQIRQTTKIHIPLTVPTSFKKTKKTGPDPQRPVATGPPKTSCNRSYTQPVALWM